jgi:rubrerythrin
MMFNHLGFFLHCAATLEREAAEGYEQLSARMDARDNPEVAAMFTQFARFSRLHHEEIERLQVQELGNQRAPIERPVWPDGMSPENPLAVAELDDISPRKAVLIALETERRACDFYSAVAGQTRSARIQQLAQEFAEEEAEHAAHLERWLERTPE